MKKPTIVFGVLLFSCALAAERSPEAQAWWSHIEYLASDALEGRLAGTPGHTKAAQYVASKFDAIALKPGGEKNSFIQPVAMETRVLDEPASSLEWISAGKTRRIQLGEEANLGIRVDRPGTVEADVVFVGYGLKIPEAKIDDFAGVDLKGKIAFYLSGAPAIIPGPLAAHSQSAAERWKTMKALGAIGVMGFADPRTSDIPWSRSTMRRLAPSLSLVDPALIETAGMKVSVVVNADHADVFLGGSGHTVQELLELHRANKPLPRFPLKGKVRAKTAFSVTPTSSENVIGVLPGASKEVVLISAHLDHLGVGGAINGDKIYNGAMDNASGIASLIEIAKVLSKQKLKRSVAFLAATGEEGGLMGSKYFATYPSAATPDIVANVNLDMFLPLIPLKAITVYGLDESDLGEGFTKAAAKFGVKTARDPEPARNAFIRSDQYSFIRRGIPALTFKFHAEPGTPEFKRVAEWRAQRYHAPSDDVKQPVEVEAAAQFNRIMAEFIAQTANQGSRPKWKSDSFFRRYAQSAKNAPAE